MRLTTHVTFLITFYWMFYDAHKGQSFWPICLLKSVKKKSTVSTHAQRNAGCWINPANSVWTASKFDKNSTTYSCPNRIRIETKASFFQSDQYKTFWLWSHTANDEAIEMKFFTISKKKQIHLFKGEYLMKIDRNVFIDEGAIFHR